MDEIVITPEMRSAVFRDMATRRHLRTKACAHCRTPFETRGRGLYCKASCRTLAYRARRAAPAPE